MRINIGVIDLTPAQFEWLRDNLAEPWQFLSEHETRACVVFEGVGLPGREAMHIEIPVRSWLGIVEHLKTITHTAEAGGADHA